MARRREPEWPTDLPARGWFGVLKRTVREFREDNLTDWGAALTYYGVLSIFPMLLALVSILGLMSATAHRREHDDDRVVLERLVGGGHDGFLNRAGERGRRASLGRRARCRRGRTHRGLPVVRAVLGVCGCRRAE